MKRPMRIAVTHIALAVAFSVAVGALVAQFTGAAPFAHSTVVGVLVYTIGAYVGFSLGLLLLSHDG